MQLAKLEFGQVWKCRSDELTVVNNPARDGYVRFKSKASSLIFEKSFRDFRESTQCLLSHLVDHTVNGKNSTTKRPTRNARIGDVIEFDGEQYIVVHGLRSKLRALSVQTGEHYSLGEVQQGEIIKETTAVEFVGKTVISIGKVWRVMEFNEFCLTAKDLDTEQVEVLDWINVGCFDIEDFGGSFNDAEDLIEMSRPLPEYEHLTFWENYIREFDRKRVAVYKGL